MDKKCYTKTPIVGRSIGCANVLTCEYLMFLLDRVDLLDSNCVGELDNRSVNLWSHDRIAYAIKAMEIIILTWI